MSRLPAFVRAAVVMAGLVALWQIAVTASGLPPYMLPSPAAVAAALSLHSDTIAHHAAQTLAEILLGLGCGVALGSLGALALAHFYPARQWLLPVLVASQAVPVFAIAPLLVLWLGYGMASKVAMATLIIFFPVTATFYDGLRRTEPGWLDLAKVMGASPARALWHLRVPAALPAFGSGLRVAAAVAPIGAVVGEWVGSSAGLGYLMLHANARMQIDVLFAALLALAAMAVTLYFAIDRLVRWLLPWAEESTEAGLNSNGKGDLT